MGFTTDNEGKRHYRIDANTGRFGFQGGRANVSSMHNMSAGHFGASATFARGARQIQEGAPLDPESHDPKQSQYLYYVVGSITSSVNGLEAAINEFFQDYVGQKSNLNSHLPDDLRMLLVNTWFYIKKEWSILDKYHEALRVCAKEPIKGDNRSENAKLVVSLRNQLVHFKPVSWDSDPPIVPDDLEGLVRKLEGKFPTNPLIPESADFWPGKCLSFGCAEWALSSALAFRGLFFERMGREDILLRPGMIPILATSKPSSNEIGDLTR